jgi:hypothetical protein
MKKYLLLTSCIFLIVNGIGQTNVYHPFPQKNAVWTNRSGSVDYTNTIIWEAPVHYCMEKGDTIINSLTYSKVNYCGGAYHGALRDNKGKVYYIPADSSHELLIYDFTLKTGDSVSAYCILGGTVYPFRKFKYDHVRVDSILIKGSYRKTINLDGNYKWIEGIGNNKSLFVESWVNVSGWVTELMCMSENDTTLFPSFSVGRCSLTVGIDEMVNDGTVTLFPNPTTGTFQLQSKKYPMRTIELIDVFGKTVSLLSFNDKIVEADISSLSSGMYVVRITDSSGNIFIKKMMKE